MKPIRVLMFGWEIPPYNSGGLGVACEGLITALGENNIEVIFVLPQKNETNHIKNVSFRFGDYCGHIKFRFVSSWLDPYDTHISYSDKISKLKSSAHPRNLIEAVLLYSQQAGVIAQEEEFDIIHAHDWLSFGAGITAKRISGKPLIVHVHATEHDRTGGQGNQEIKTLEKQGITEADQVITVSNFTKQTVVDEYQIDDQKISVVHNGSNFSNTVPASLPVLNIKKPNEKMVLFLGRITVQKGPDYFVKMAKKVIEVRPNTIFVMAGSGDMHQQMIELSAQLGVADNFFFPGFIRGAELHSLYENADVYVMPSVSEPFGLVAIESLAKGTPVVISKQSGVSEVLSHALKANFWDIEDLADKVISALDDPYLYNQLSTSGRKESFDITWDKAAKKCKEIYENLLNSFKPNKKPKKR